MQNCRRLFLAEIPVFHHLLENILLPLRSQIWVRRQRVDGWRIGDSGQQRGFVIRHVRRLLPKVARAGVPDTVIAIAKVNGVDIQLQDLVL